MHPQTIVVGDIHGCIDEFEHLLQIAEYDKTKGDRLFLVGDLVGKGPESLKVVRKAREIGAFCVKGNHDHVLVRYYNRFILNDESVEITESMTTYGLFAKEFSTDDWQFILTLPLYLTIPEFNAIVVHAGLIPNTELENQEPNLLMNIRNILEDGKGAVTAEAGAAWVSLWKGPECVLFGHDAVRGLQIGKDDTGKIIAIGLDTGACYGGKLSACILPNTIIQVHSRCAYSKPNIPLRPGDTEQLSTVNNNGPKEEVAKTEFKHDLFII